MSDHPPTHNPHQPFDPDAAASDSDTLFGLPEHSDPLIEVLPVPFEATTSYRQGTAAGPAAIAEASLQVDLHDARFGDVWQAGICSLDPLKDIPALAVRASALAQPIIQAGGATPDDHARVQQLDEIGEQLTTQVRDAITQIFARDRIPAMLGGEHSISLGAIQAATQAHPGTGVFQIDAHLDLRERFEGLTHSHASVMFNALERAHDLSKIVVVGVRDHGRTERKLAESDPRITMFTDDDLADDLAAGRTFRNWCDEVIAALPQSVYLSFDIDALEPSLCPSTGTPVPGGFTWHQISVLLGALAQSNRRIVGFDLVETGASPDQPIDAIVAARLLYRLCGVVATQHRRL